MPDVGSARVASRRAWIRSTPTGYSKSARASTSTTGATGRWRWRSGISWRGPPESRCGNCWAGSSDRYRAYASTGERVEPAVRVERLLAWQEQGVRAAKIRFNHSDWREDVKVVEAAREAVGSGMELMVDANHGWRMAGDLSRRWDLATAQECARALGDLGVFWLEEPFDTADIDGYAALRETSPVPNRRRGDGAVVVRDPAPRSTRST